MQPGKLFFKCSLRRAHCVSSRLTFCNAFSFRQSDVIGIPESYLCYDLAPISQQVRCLQVRFVVSSSTWQQGFGYWQVWVLQGLISDVRSCTEAGVYWASRARDMQQPLVGSSRLSSFHPPPPHATIFQSRRSLKACAVSYFKVHSRIAHKFRFIISSLCCIQGLTMNSKWRVYIYI